MNTLNQREISTLLEIITESLGTDATFESFASSVLWLLDDISGFEAAPEATLRLIVNNLWRNYREQKDKTSK
jgi:hypothetical protein